MRLALAALLCVVAVPGWAAGLPSFDTFRIGPPYQGPLARPVLSTAEAKSYRTRLNQGARAKPNFAGRYHMVTWGCGTSCSMGAAEDAATGKVVFIPFSICCYAGSMDAPDWDAIQFRADSSLVVFHGQRNEQGVNGDHYYSFDGNGFKFLATNEVREPSPPSSVAEHAASAAPPPQEIQTCQKIADGDARLKCYDAVTNYRK